MPVLLRKCKLGISGTDLLWFRHYLTDRQQRVKLGDSYSDWGTALGGIPQGSALGPLLFLIYINDMSLQVKNGILVQFADDTCLICYENDHSSVSQMLCEDLRSLHLQLYVCMPSSWQGRAALSDCFEV